MNWLLKSGLTLARAPDKTIADLDKALPGMGRLAALAKKLEPIIEKMDPLLEEALPIIKKAWPDIVADWPAAEEILDLARGH